MKDFGNKISKHTRNTSVVTVIIAALRVLNDVNKTLKHSYNHNKKLNGETHASGSGYFLFSFLIKWNENKSEEL